MSISSPALLTIGLLVAVALACATVALSRRRARTLAASGVTAGSARMGQGAGAWFTIAGLAVLAVAVSGPSATVPVTTAKGTVILAMDVSGSMGATDVAPSRLGAAQRAAVRFIQAQPVTVNIGVIAFEQGGLMAALPSSDHASAVAAVDHLTVGGSTSLGSAILVSLSALTRKTITVRAGHSPPDIGYWPSATIVLFSDGQDEQQGSSDITAATAVAQKAGVHVDTVGVGTTAGTTVDVDGYHLFTALDPGSLKSIAQATGGSYHSASDAAEMDSVARTIPARLTVTHQPEPLAGEFVLAALMLLAAGGALTILRSGRVI